MDKVGECIPNAEIYSRSLDTIPQGRNYFNTFSSGSTNAIYI